MVVPSMCVYRLCALAPDQAVVASNPLLKLHPPASPPYLRRAFRRSELTGIGVADLTFTKDGLVIDLRRSKTDQEARGRKVGIPFRADKST